MLTRLRDPTVFGGLLGSALVFVVYEMTSISGYQVLNTYVHVADSLLKLRLDIPEVAPHLDWVLFEGRRYSHQAPLPGLLLVPFVAVFGIGFNLVHFGAVLGAAIAGAVWVCVTRIGLTGRDRILVWLLPVFGTTIWYEGKNAQTWGIAALCSVLFLFMALGEWFGPRVLWRVGLFVGLAALCRPPSILAMAGFALAVRRPAALVQLGAGAAGPVAALVGYNFARFGTITDLSQELHYNRDPYRLTRPPGLFSIRHVPFNLYSWFFLAPTFDDRSAPFYVRPTLMGTALPLTSPALVAALGALRDRWLWVCAAAAVLPAAFYYANGFAQFGIRYLLDAVPFLTALVALAVRDRRAPAFPLLLAVSIAINAYGVVYTNLFDLAP